MAEDWDANHPTNWADSVRNAWAAANVGDPIGDTWEPDGSIDHAKDIEFDVQQLHSIKPASDHDWMTFTINETTTVGIETSGPSGNTRMWLRDDQGSEIEYDDDDGYGLFSKIIRELDAGTYYIEIDEYGNNHEIPTYYVNLIDLTNAPDLTIPSIYTWDYYGYPYCRVGQPTVIHVTTKNEGNTSVGSTSKTGLYINDDYLGYWNIEDLDAHSSSGNGTILYFWTSGYYSIEAKADKYETITEKDEDNNWGGPNYLYIYPY